MYAGLTINLNGTEITCFHELTSCDLGVVHDTNGGHVNMGVINFECDISALNIDCEDQDTVILTTNLYCLDPDTDEFTEIDFCSTEFQDMLYLDDEQCDASFTQQVKLCCENDMNQDGEEEDEEVETGGNNRIYNANSSNYEVEIINSDIVVNGKSDSEKLIQYHIYNLSGQIIKSGTHYISNQNYIIQNADLEAGYYIFSIDDRNSRSSFPFVKF